MTTTRAQDLAARYTALPESIKSRCPRPLVNVTPEKVRAWMERVRTVCLDSASATLDLALTVARRGDLAAALELRSEAADLLNFARDLGDLMKLPPARTTERS